MSKRSIILGLACGLGVIGSLYGNDFSKNKQKALKYYSEEDFDAAYEYCIKSDQNDPEILQRLAWMYSTGSGVQKNMSKAIVLSKKAANAGNGKSALYYAVWALIPQKKYDDALKDHPMRFDHFSQTVELLCRCVFFENDNHFIPLSGFIGQKKEPRRI